MHVPYIGNGEKAPFYFGREANRQSATMLRNDAQVGRKVQDEQSVWFHLYGIQSTTHQIARVSRRVFLRVSCLTCNVPCRCLISNLRLPRTCIISHHQCTIDCPPQALLSTTAPTTFSLIGHGSRFLIANHQPRPSASIVSDVLALRLVSPSHPSLTASVSSTSSPTLLHTRRSDCRPGGGSRVQGRMEPPGGLCANGVQG